MSRRVPGFRHFFCERQSSDEELSRPESGNGIRLEWGRKAVSRTRTQSSSASTMLEVDARLRVRREWILDDRPNSSMTVARGINPRGTSSACSAMLLVRTDCPQARVIELAFRGTDGQAWPSVTRDAELTATGNTTLSDPLIGATLVA